MKRRRSWRRATERLKALNLPPPPHPSAPLTDHEGEGVAGGGSFGVMEGCAGVQCQVTTASTGASGLCRCAGRYQPLDLGG